MLAVSTLLIDLIYLVPRRPGLIPLKFLVPGTVFLVAFQIAPILYTVNVAFTNYSTGHIISKAAAITAIKQNSLQPAQSGTTYAMAAARDKNGDLVLILQDQTSGKTYVGTQKGLTPIPRGRRHGQGRRDRRRDRLQARPGEGAGRDRPAAHRLPRAARRRTPRSSRRASTPPSRCSRRSATTRSAACSSGSPTGQCSATTGSARSSPRRRRSSSRAGRPTSGSATSAGRSTTR